MAIVTGAGSGIGAATAVALAREGAAVACVDIDEDSAQATAACLVEAGSMALAVQADVSNEADTERMARSTVDRFGQIDVLHNNAGVGVYGAAHELTLDEWNRSLAVNLTGVFLGSRAVLPQMLRQSSGCIINTCSTFATVGAPALAAYHAAKGGVRALTISMARDYSPDIRVNSISPGVTDTPLARRTPDGAPASARVNDAITASHRLMKRRALPAEIATAVVFLACDDSSFVTGHDLVLGGGHGVVAF
uniref:SDR family NAD(P)-dependent oxidoreductase n=1 Tax=Nocardioides terrisoli TaxID=3388267 RepID=UPI0037CBF729